MTEHEKIEWCTVNMLTGNGNINRNKTRNGFEYIKKHNSDVWTHLAGCVVCIGDKTIDFNVGNIYDPVVLNGMVFFKGGRTGYSVVYELLRDYDTNQDDYTFIDIAKYCISLRLSGLYLYDMCKRCFPTEFEKLSNIRKSCEHDREAVYLYINGMDTPPSINGTPLEFHTYDYGYIFGESVEYYTSVSDVNTLCECILRQSVVSNNGIKVLKFFPDLTSDILSIFDITEVGAEHVYMLGNSMSEPPLCVECGSVTTFDCIAHGYHMFCSATCSASHRGALRFKNNPLNTRDYYEYKNSVHSVSNMTYKLYVNEINPNNYTRGRGSYHLDHIIPVSKCYVMGLSVEVASHRFNLQMLTEFDNLSKGVEIDTTLNVGHLIEIIEEDIHNGI
jgi:hypothetical protein